MNQGAASGDSADLADIKIELGDQNNGASSDLEKGEETSAQYMSTLPELLKDAANPTACVFHMLFKLMALALYLFFGLLSSDKTLKYIFIITLAALDFWTVKNVTGR